MTQVHSHCHPCGRPGQSAWLPMSVWSRSQCCNHLGCKTSPEKVNQHLPHSLLTHLCLPNKSSENMERQTICPQLAFQVTCGCMCFRIFQSMIGVVVPCIEILHVDYGGSYLNSHTTHDLHVGTQNPKTTLHFNTCILYGAVYECLLFCILLFNLTYMPRKSIPSQQDRRIT